MTDQRHRPLTSEEATAKARADYESRRRDGKSLEDALAAARARNKRALAMAHGGELNHVVAEILCANAKCRARVGTVYASGAGPVLTFDEPTPFLRREALKVARSKGGADPTKLVPSADLLACFELGEAPLYVMWCPTHAYLELDGDELISAIGETSGKLQWRASFASVL